jgi:hypothetical protein
MFTMATESISAVPVFRSDEDRWDAVVHRDRAADGVSAIRYGHGCLLPAELRCKAADRRT